LQDQRLPELLPNLRPVFCGRCGLRLRGRSVGNGFVCLSLTLFQLIRTKRLSLCPIQRVNLISNIFSLFAKRSKHDEFLLPVEVFVRGTQKKPCVRPLELFLQTQNLAPQSTGQKKKTIGLRVIGTRKSKLRHLTVLPSKHVLFLGVVPIELLLHQPLLLCRNQARVAIDELCSRVSATGSAATMCRA
jgi:hypothetical protein